MLIPNEVEAKNLTLAVSIVGLVIVSNFNIPNLPLYNQSFAFIESNERISDSIKKACPDYEDNSDIKGLLNDILKACMARVDNNPPPINPDQGTFDENTMTFSAFMYAEGQDDKAHVVLTDIARNLSKSYDVDAHTPLPPKSLFVIPIGDKYQVVANITSESDAFYTVNFNSDDCKQTNPYLNYCTGTMDNSNQDVSVIIQRGGP